MQAVEPRDTIFIGERNAGVHLLAIRLAVVVVAFGVLPAGKGYEFIGDGGFSRAGDTHQNDDHACGFPDS